MRRPSALEWTSEKPMAVTAKENDHPTIQLFRQQSLELNDDGHDCKTDLTVFNRATKSLKYDDEFISLVDFWRQISRS